MESNSSNRYPSLKMVRGIVRPEKNVADPSLVALHIPGTTNSPDGSVGEQVIYAYNGLNTFHRTHQMNGQVVTSGNYNQIPADTPVFALVAGDTAVIIGIASNNVSVPDVTKRDDLTVVAHTPKGKVISLDDRNDNIIISHGKGESTVALADNLISLEISETDDESNKQRHTSFEISKNAFIFRMKEATMKFDETGLSVTFDSTDKKGHSSYFSVTRDSINIYGQKSVHLNADELINMVAEKAVLNGTSETEILSSNLKLSGTQLTKIAGTQIEMEAFWDVHLKAMHIGIQAVNKITEFAALKQSGYTTENKTVGVYSESSATHNVWTGTFNVGAVALFLDTRIVESSGLGLTAASTTWADTDGVMLAAHTALATTGTALLLKTSANGIINKALGSGQFLAGGASPGQEPIIQVSGAKDNTTDKTLVSIANNHYHDQNDAAASLAFIDPALRDTLTAYYTNGGKPMDTEVQLRDTIFSSNIIQGLETSNKKMAMSAANTGHNIAGVTMENSCEIMSTDGYMATLRKALTGCAGYEGTGKPKQCGREDGLVKAQTLAEEYQSNFGADLLYYDNIHTDGGTQTYDIDGHPTAPSHCGM